MSAGDKGHTRPPQKTSPFQYTCAQTLPHTCATLDSEEHHKQSTPALSTQLL